MSDGLSKLGHKHGGFLEGLHIYSPGYRTGKTKTVGQAFTVKFVTKEDKNAPKVQGNYVCAQAENNQRIMHRHRCKLIRLFLD